MSTNDLNHSSAISNVTNLPMSRLEKALLYGIVAPIAAWLLICVLATQYIRFCVPLSESDMEEASWLWYTIPLHFTTGVLPISMGVMFILVGIAMAIARSSFLSALLGISLGVFLCFGGGEATVLRLAVAQGWAKIGCWTYTSRECREMLNLPTDNALSMYGADGAWAEWYTKIRANEPAPLLYSMPGVTYLTAPLVAMNIDGLISRIRQQRAQVARMRNTPS